MLYSEKVMDHFQHPRNLGKMEEADGIGEVGNAKCGDIMKMYIKVDAHEENIGAREAHAAALINLGMPKLHTGLKTG